MKQNGKQEHLIHRIYLVFVIIALLIIFVSAICCKLKLTVPVGRDFSEILDYKSEWMADLSLPQGGADLVSFQVTVTKPETDLIFYSLHQSVFVYVDGNLIYELEPTEDNIWSRSPGHDWISVPLKEGSRQVEIELIPAYESSKGAIPTLYFGSEWGVYLATLQAELILFLLAFLAIFVGLAFVAAYVNGRMNAKDSKNILYLGEFAIIIGIWKMTDLQSIDLIVPNKSWLSMLTLLALYYAIIPFSLFMKSMFTLSFSRIFHVICYINLGFLSFNIIAQVIGFCDFRENLKIGHAIVVIVILVSFGCAIAEMVKKGITKKMLAVVGCLILCFAGTIIDMFIYYRFRGMIQFGFGMLAFDIYIIAFGILTIRSSQELIQKGKEAGKYQNMAFHDELTGLYSRAAYADHVHDAQFHLVDTTVFMFDLNDLKACNDNLGHEAGDAYLKESASLILNVFSGIGKCFRMGGDEFCCVTQKKFSHRECEMFLAKLYEAQKKKNAEDALAFQIQIAAGYASFREKEDYDINDTFRRADKRMYRKKQELKVATKEKNGASNKHTKGRNKKVHS